MENNIKFSSVLRELMKKNPVSGEKITQQKLADILDISKQSVYLYLAGEVYPGYSQLLKIAGYFGVSVEYLLTGKQPENKLIRESLRLSDNAVENIESCDKDFAVRVNELLSDKNFFASYQAATQNIQEYKNFTTGGESIEFTKNDKKISKDTIISNAVFESGVTMYSYFKKFFESMIKE